MTKIIVEGLPGCLPCKKLHVMLENEGIEHEYRVVDGEVGVCYPHVIVDGREITAKDNLEYIHILRCVG